jgi:hypothetical protein
MNIFQKLFGKHGLGLIMFLGFVLLITLCSGPEKTYPYHIHDTETVSVVERYPSAPESFVKAVMENWRMDYIGIVDGGGGWLSATRIGDSVYYNFNEREKTSLNWVAPTPYESRLSIEIFGGHLSDSDVVQFNKDMEELLDSLYLDSCRYREFPSTFKIRPEK